MKGFVRSTWGVRIAYVALLVGATMAVVAGNWFAGTLGAAPHGHRGPRADHRMAPSAFAFPELHDDVQGPALAHGLGGTRIARPSPHEDRIISRYQARASMRPFVLQALDGKSDRATAYYALTAVDECSSLLSSGTGLASQPAFDAQLPNLEVQRRVDAWNYYQVRCADFSPAELKELTEQLADRLRRSGLKIALPGAEGAGGAGQQARDDASVETRVVDGLALALREVLQYVSPALFDTVGWENILPPQTGDGGARFFYKSRTYHEREDPAFFDALNLLPCGLGLKCTATEGQVGTRCAAGQGCDADRFDAVRQKAGATPGRYEQALDYYQQMVTSINTGCIDDFKP